MTENEYYTQELETFKKYNPNAIFINSELRDHRLNTCLSCDQYAKQSIAQYCKKCLCYMPVKTWINNTVCPEKKW